MGSSCVWPNPGLPLPKIPLREKQSKERGPTNDVDGFRHQRLCVLVAVYLSDYKVASTTPVFSGRKCVTEQSKAATRERLKTGHPGPSKNCASVFRAQEFSSIE